MCLSDCGYCSNDSIFPAVITIESAADGNVSSVRLSVLGHSPLVPQGCRHDSAQFLRRVSHFILGVFSALPCCCLSRPSIEYCINLALTSADYLRGGIFRIYEQHGKAYLNSSNGSVIKTSAHE